MRISHTLEIRAEQKALDNIQDNLFRKGKFSFANLIPQPAVFDAIGNAMGNAGTLLREFSRSKDFGTACAALISGARAAGLTEAVRGILTEALGKQKTLEDALSLFKEAGDGCPGRDAWRMRYWGTVSDASSVFTEKGAEEGKCFLRLRFCTMETVPTAFFRTLEETFAPPATIFVHSEIFPT